MKKIIFTILIFTKLIYGEELALIKIATVPEKSIYITQPPSDKDRLFVLNQRGLIHVIKNGENLKNPFLDITDRVHGTLNPGSKEGALGFAFHPNYKKNGFFFLHYINKKDTSVISRFSANKNRDFANKNSEKVIMEIAQPNGINIGGHLAFGPKDGFLYIAFGSSDQISANINNAQDLTNLYGSIIRININNDPYSIPADNPFVGEYYKRPEIFCYGLKNPWRFSFDKVTNDLIIADISQESWEEVNWNNWTNSKGANFGWNIMEGKHCHDEEDFCDTTKLKQPIYEYPNNVSYIRKLINMGDQETSGCSITGGYVYRGKKHESLYGAYIFGDYCTGRIWAFKKFKNNIAAFKNLRTELKDKSKSLPITIASFGEDNSGELYIVDYMGSIYKFISN